MILFSTILPVKKEMTKEDFIHTVIEWNQESPHPENVIEDIQWDGSFNAHFGNDHLSMDFMEYRNENILAVRFEKKDADGTIWDTHYIMNFNERKISIQLERSYVEDAIKIDQDFSTPHFITMLIERGYLEDDGNLPVLRTPVIIEEDNLSLLDNLINGKADYQLPVVYISKTADNQDPVDTWRLASRLKGVAHVWVEKDQILNSRIREVCDNRNEYNGSTGIYYPNDSPASKRIFYRNTNGFAKKTLERIVQNVIQYANAQTVNPLYTWQGVSNALLRDRLTSRSADLKKVQNEKEDTDLLLESVDEDLSQFKKEIEELTAKNEALQSENQGLRARLTKDDRNAVLYLGEEEEFFPDEIKAILLETLEEGVKKMEPGSRRHTVLQDVIAANDCKRTAAEKEKELCHLLKGYKTMTGTMRKSLQDMGFTVTDDGKHYKLVFYGDSRYTFTLGKTPSDNRAGINNVKGIVKKAL